MAKQLSLMKIIVPLGLIVVLYLVTAASPTWSQSGEAAAAASEAQEPTPPSGQQYTGVKQCASCHFEQFMKWKATKHANTFELLPENYQTNAECLKCHTTGFGQPSGFTTLAATPDLKGTTCEVCHGPGSVHGEIAKKYANQKLTPEQEKEVRDSIWKIEPKNVCISCHMVQGHHESATPPELRKSK